MEDKLDIKCVCPILGDNSLPKSGCICDCVAHMETLLLSFSTDECTNDVVHSVTTLQKGPNGIGSHFVDEFFTGAAQVL